MVQTSESPKTELIESLASRVAELAPPELRPFAARFLRHYYAPVAPDDILDTPPEALVGSVLSLLEAARVRSPGETRVRALEPGDSGRGWTLPHTVLEIVNDDMPFLVDSVAMELQREGRTLHLLIHPIVRVRRDADGRLLDVVEPDETLADARAESWMHIEVDAQSDPAAREALRTRLLAVLADVRNAVADWQPMRRRLADVVAEVMSEVEGGRLPMPREVAQESVEFLRWLDDAHFTFLGFRRYDLVREGGREYLRPQGAGLGILRELTPEAMARAAAPIPPEFLRYAQRPELLIVTKANRVSTVHRPVHMDRISIKRFDPAGQLVGEDRFLGLFTSGAYSRGVQHIPLLRRKAERTLASAGLDPHSHDGKALVQILESFPRDEMFQISEEELFAITMGVLQLQERQRIALFTRLDPLERFVSCLVYIPRDRYSTELREKIGRILEDAWAGEITANYTQVTDAPLARAHYIVATTPAHVPRVDPRKVEAAITLAARTWSDLLRDALVAAKGEETGLALHRRYENAFPTAYRERFAAAAGLADVACLDEVRTTHDVGIELYPDPEGAPGAVRCKIFHGGAPVALSELLPRLENMGLRVVTEEPYEIQPAGDGEPPLWIRDFGLTIPAGVEVDAALENRRFRETLSRVWHGEVEDDGFNRLILAADLEWYQVVVLRAYARYLKQARIPFSQRYMQETLGRNHQIARLLVELFEARFEPALAAEERARRVTDLEARLGFALDRVANLDEDRVLRRFENVVQATVRTNYFQRDAAGRRKPYLSFKLRSRRVRKLPKPRPMFEIWVYSPRVDGIHLRGGMVARGGIRWSDRPEDFRTEILGLMKAQMVKNAVIVPVGSKGGFVVRRPPVEGGREAMQREGIECYKTLMRGLLDLTDNIVQGEIVGPKDVVRCDEKPDAYLVVAADKGTATFSDIANSVSIEYGHWLGDAFASGGSAGYDHKKMGITARGAWESVKRHFRELGVDCQTTDFTCVGVGDMSGDVFGNGMLLSRHTRLVGAFNHLHIFVDPDPDPAVSFAERQRLFDLPRSSWGDYDRSKLSPGGAVFDRTAKSITVSPEVQRRFELDSDTVTPAELMKAILRAPVDLLYLGGIGTYVKASSEPQSAAGDRNNDALRIDATELRCKVVGEGANLGFTQRGRIEYALVNKGKINTDAIDNSAGVDTSDHEVNIKIAVDDAIARGEMSSDERLPFLAAMTEEVGQLVLRDNYQQTQAISVAQTQGVALLDAQARLMRRLEREGKLDRAIEFLPDDEELGRRQASRQGLTRPELAILLAYSKIDLYSEILESDLWGDPLLAEDLVNYFPTGMRGRLPAAIDRHRLRREIIATYVTNSMVNRVGPTFVTTMMEATGRTVGDVTRAYTIARDALDLRPVWAAIEALDNVVPAALQISMFQEVGRLLERTTLWLLRSGETLDISRRVEEFRPRVAAVAAELEQLLPAAELAAFEARLVENEKWGIPRDLARRLASLEPLASAPDIVRLARDSRHGVEAIAGVYFGLGSRFGLGWLRSGAASLATDTPWQRAAVTALVDDLYAHQSTLAARVLHDADGAPAEAAITRWSGAHAAAVARIDGLLAELRALPAVDLAMLTVANQNLRFLVGEG